MTRSAPESLRDRRWAPRLVGGLVSAALLAAAPGGLAAQTVDPYAEPPAPAPQDPYGDPPAKPKLPDTPADPYPEPRPTGAPQDPYAAQDAAARELDEAVAASLVERARLLLDQRAYADARQLAVEALVRSPDGRSAPAARAVLASANRQLGIAEATGDPATTAAPAPHPDGTVDPYAVDQPAAPALRRDRPESGRPLLTLYGVGTGAVVGTALGGALSSDDALGLTLGAVAGGVLGGIVADQVGDRTRPSYARARAIGSGAMWGGAGLGLFADVLDLDGTTATDVAIGASLGALGGGALGALIASKHAPSTGDVALVDSVAGWGLTGGLTLGVLMQPYEAEGYTLNAALGTAAGAAVGLLAARRRELSSDRMVRVNLWAYASAAAPWVVYALFADHTTNDDEQAVGLLSTVGLAGGALVGFRVTRHWGAGSADAASDAPAALLRRGSDGAWAMGGLAVRPAASGLGPRLGQGALVDLVGVRF
jgi:hypothetical protein